MTVEEVLRAARESLARPGVWVGQAPMEDHECVTTACVNVPGVGREWNDAANILDFLARREGFNSKEGGVVRPAAQWNDAPGRTLDEVLALFDEAIEIARKAP